MNWLPVVGWEGLYEVSDRGHVRSSRQMLRPSKDRSGKGHLRVCLGHDTWRSVHSLMLEAFVGPRPPGLLGLHKDDDKDNNTLENLYWGTYSDNMRDSIRNGKYQNGNSVKVRCVNEHEFTPENTYIRSNGQRQCKECQRQANRASREKRRATA